MSKLLEVQDLKITLSSDKRESEVIKGISFHVDKEETVGLVGESGSGKSMTTQAIMKLIPKHCLKSLNGTIHFKDQNLIDKTEKEMQSIRGKEIAMIFQDPMTALDPTMKIGKQIVEAIRQHHPVSFAQARQQTLQLLHDVEISHPEKRFEQYPFELSGGMRQRVMIAIALSCTPSLLIADEPTTSLDVTVQAQILELIGNLKRKHAMSLLLITHNLGIVAKLCDRVIMLHQGKIVETGSVDSIFYQPQNPYTINLLKSVPKPQWIATNV